ncbi:DUF3662 and FHA domain-containing protein [soil metagenome]
MTEKLQDSRKTMSADWFVRGVLTKVGDTIDRLTGRRREPSSNLATSELIERVKDLLDSESKEIEGKGIIVPHNICLKIEWNKFSTDSDEVLPILERELLTAAADYINNSLYYTLAPLDLKVTPDYFTEGIKLFASFDNFLETDDKKELSITLPSLGMSVPRLIETGKPLILLSCVDPNGKREQVYVEVPTDGRVSIGRSSGNHFAIDDSSISKIHASLSISPEGEISVADTGSTNGTFINGNRMPYGNARKIEPSDTVKFGTVELMFNVESRAAEIEEQASAGISGEKIVAIGEFGVKAETSFGPDESQPAQPKTVEAKVTSESDKESE